MKASINYILIGFAAICIMSCSPVLYSPVGQNVPLFEERGEVALSAGICDSDVGFIYFGGNYASGFNVQDAAALTDKVAITSSFYRMSGSPVNDADAAISGNGWHWEFSGGRYGAFQKKIFKWEILAGTGFGAIKNKIDNDHLNLTYQKPFIQPSIAIKWKYVEFAFTSKLTLINYTTHDVSFSEVEKNDKAEAFFRDKRLSSAYEPGFTFRAGLRGIKLQIQTCYTSFNYAGWSDRPAINQLFTSLNVFYRFQSRKESPQTVFVFKPSNHR